MIDLIIAYLVLIVVILLVIIAFLTFYIIYERRKTTIVPLLTLKTNDQSSGDHSNSATHKRITKRLRQRSRTLFIRTQNSQGFLLSNGNLSPHPHKLIQQTTNSTIDQTTIHFDY